MHYINSVQLTLFAVIHMVEVSKFLIITITESRKISILDSCQNKMNVKRNASPHSNRKKTMRCRLNVDWLAIFVYMN